MAIEDEIVDKELQMLSFLPLALYDMLNIWVFSHQWFLEVP